MRVRTALYKGDLAKVVDADYSAGKATVKIVPRLDYAAMALRRDEGRAAGQPFGRPAGAVRPPARSAPYMPLGPLNAQAIGVVGISPGGTQQLAWGCQDACMFSTL